RGADSIQLTRAAKLILLARRAALRVALLRRLGRRDRPWRRRRAGRLLAADAREVRPAQPLQGLFRDDRGELVQLVSHWSAGCRLRLKLVSTSRRAREGGRRLC